MSSVQPLPIPPYKKRSKVWGVLFMFLFVLLLAGGGIYFYYMYYLPQQAQKGVEKQEETASSQDIVTKVRGMIELPSEEPTIATVSDVSQLKDQDFFTNAQNGDKVLIFQKSGKAVLFRPSTDKIIEVGPVTIDLTAPSASSSGQIQNSVEVVLYNGTATVGITKKVEVDLATSQPKVEVVDRDNAKGTYEKTLVVDLSGKRATDAKTLAESVDGEVGKLPQGETSPEGDILIIVGENYE